MGGQIVLGSGDLPDDGEVSLFSAAYRSFNLKGANKEAFNFLVEAAKDGDPRAIYALASWYATGTYVKQSHKKSAFLLKKASRLGHVEATHAFAVCAENGTGMHESPKIAFNYYTKAALMGSYDALKDVKRCFYYGIGTSIDKNMFKLIDKLSKKL